MLFTQTVSVTSISLLEDLLGNHILNSHVLQRRAEKAIKEGAEERREKKGERGEVWEV